MLAAFMPHSYAQTHTIHLGLFFTGRTVHCALSSVERGEDRVGCRCDSVNTPDYPPPASLVPRHLCQSHSGLSTRRQPSAPPPRSPLPPFLLAGKSTTKKKKRLEAKGNKRRIQLCCYEFDMHQYKGTSLCYGVKNHSTNRNPKHTGVKNERTSFYLLCSDKSTHILQRGHLLTRLNRCVFFRYRAKTFCPITTA